MSTTKQKTIALVVLSGGQDSTTCLYWAKTIYDEVHAITINYGQRHALEIEAAIKIAQMADIASHEIVEVPGILKSVSPLTSNSDLERYANYEEMDKIIGDRVELTFVPMRNTFFFVLAMNRAVALNADALVTGICQADNANYPDCRESYRQEFELMANLSLGRHADDYIEVVAPLMYYSKAETVQLANKLPGCMEALAYSHTSYDGKYPPTDNNHANVLRAQGFLEANLPDPLVIRAVQEGLMSLPDTPNYEHLTAYVVGE